MLLKVNVESVPAPIKQVKTEPVPAPTKQEAPVAPEVIEEKPVELEPIANQEIEETVLQVYQKRLFFLDLYQFFPQYH